MIGEPRDARATLAMMQVSIQVILSGVHLWHQRVLGIDPTAEGDAAAGGAP